MKLLVFICGLVVTLGSLEAVAEDLPAEAQKLLDDLGAVAVQQKNNDKVLPCSYGGTKRITISPLQDAIVFTGEFNNCRERGETRDGYYEYIVKNGELVGKSSQRSKNGLFFDACRDGKLAEADKLIRDKADVNYTESISSTDGGHVHDWTPLMSAAVSGNLELVKLLVRSGARVNYLNSHVLNALWLAANNGHSNVVAYLISRHAYIHNQSDDDVTPLMAAAMNGHLEVVRVLLGAGARVDDVHKDGDSALMFALAQGHTAIARLLVDAGSDINIQNRFGASALIIATAEGNLEMVRLLLDKKANVSAKTDGGKTALDVAILKGNAAVQELLKKAVR
jgi:ankyrin repeat protein